MKNDKMISYHQKKRNAKKRYQSKGKIALGTGSFVLVGLICLVIGFGFAYGWGTVAKWLYSEYAILIYVVLIVWALIIVWLIYMDKVSNNGR